MNYIDVKPLLMDGRFMVRIELSEQAVSDTLTFDVTARRSDGVYETARTVYPVSAGLFAEDGIVLDMFSLNGREYGQIISVKVNGHRVDIAFGEVPGLAGYRFRYDDSVLKVSLFIPKSVHIDFQVIPTYDPKTLLIADHSEWGAMAFREAVVEITPPGYEKPETVYWGKGQVNSFNSFILGLSCVEDCKPVFIDLPDGVYSMLLKASDGNRKHRMYLKTDLLRRKLDRLYVSETVSCGAGDSARKSTVRKAEFYLTAAEAHMRLGNFLESNELYCMADRIAEGCGGIEN
jgi:hypothetical protein